MLGYARVLLWYCFCIALVLLWYCSGIARVLLWYCFGIARVLLWYYSGIARVLLWYCLSMLGYRLGMLGYCSGIAWVLLGYCSGIARVFLGYAWICLDIARVLISHFSITDYQVNWDLPMASRSEKLRLKILYQSSPLKICKQPTDRLTNQPTDKVGLLGVAWGCSGLAQRLVFSGQRYYDC